MFNKGQSILKWNVLLRSSELPIVWYRPSTTFFKSFCHSQIKQQHYPQFGSIFMKNIAKMRFMLMKPYVSLGYSELCKISRTATRKPNIDLNLPSITLIEFPIWKNRWTNDNKHLFLHGSKIYAEKRAKLTYFKLIGASQYLKWWVVLQNYTCTKCEVKNMQLMYVFLAIKIYLRWQWPRFTGNDFKATKLSKFWEFITL